MSIVDDVRIIPIVRAYWRAFRPYAWKFILIAILAVVSSILEGVGITAIVPIFSFVGGSAAAAPASTIATFISGVFSFFHMPFTFRILLLFVAVLFIVRTIVLFAIQYVTARVGFGYERDLRTKLFKFTVNARWPYLSRQHIGNLEQLLTTNTSQAAQIINSLVTTLIIGTKSLMYVIVAIAVSGWVAVLSLVVGGTVFFFLRPLLYRTRLLATTIERTNRALAHFTGEHVIGMKAIKSMALESPVAKKAGGYFDSIRSLNLKIVIFRSVVEMGIRFAGVAFVGAVFVVMYRSPSFSLAAFAVIVYAINQIFTQVQIGQTQLHAFGTMTPYLTQILAYMDESKNEVERDGEGVSFSFLREIVFQNVAFSYPERKAAIADVSFTVKKGELVGIIGPSGAGKTTIADLLLRLVDPLKGSITSDGTEIHRISRHEWRTNVGYVAQDAVLLNDTIEANIRFYNESISREELHHAARLANIHEFIETLPDGYNAVVGERGVFLSGGQRQRIALARILARKPSLLVLDEATSSLDAESEREIRSAVEHLRGDTSVLIIAHRMSTVSNVDRLVILQDGKVSETGTPSELLSRKNSYYAKMLKPDAHADTHDSASMQSPRP